MTLHWNVTRRGLDLEFYTDVSKLLEESPYTWYVTAGLRSREQQQALYRRHLAGGPLAAAPGKSAHEWGLAIDVVLDGSERPGLQMVWDTKHRGWLWLVRAIWQHPRLHSLWKVGDWPHIQSTHWKGGRYAGTPDFQRWQRGRPIVG